MSQPEKLNEPTNLYTRYGCIEKINQLALHTIEYKIKVPAKDVLIAAADLDVTNIAILNVYALLGSSIDSTTLPQPIAFVKKKTTDETTKVVTWQLHVQNNSYSAQKIQKIYINYTQ